MVDDSVAYALVAATGFFLAVSIGLLYRYRQASQQANASTDLGRDLWAALDQRMKRQDERIIDLMARVEVLQARVTREPPTAGQPVVQMTPMPMPAPAAEAKPAEQVVQPPVETREAEPHPAASPTATSESPESHTLPQTASPLSESVTPPLSAPVSVKPVKLDKTSLAALGLLQKKALTTKELWEALDLSREHTSRLMKNLLERGLVMRDDADKPYTYQLTGEGRRYLTSGSYPNEA